MARRATYLDGVWNEGVAVLNLDGGDLFGQRQMVEKEQTRFLCEVSSTFGIDAIGLGERDLNYGIQFLRDMISTYKLPFINANVKDSRTGDLILPPYVIVERGGVRFGIVSVLDPMQKIVTMSQHDPEYIVEDPLVTLRRLIPEIRKKAETVILISHMGDNLTEELLKGLEGVDICLVGHTFRQYSTERVVLHTVLLGAGHEGRFIGRCDATIGSKGDVSSFTIGMTSLDDTIADDPVVAEKVSQFKEHLKEFRTSLRGEHQQNKGSDQEQFLTERTCQKCHQDSWEVVKASAHESALASLRTKGQGFNPDCLVCHVVGYEYKNGYDDVAPYNALSNVQCEACHGYGTMHTRDGSMLKMARESCVGCHDQENSPNFNYAAYWEKIKH